MKKFMIGAVMVIALFGFGVQGLTVSAAELPPEHSTELPPEH